MNEKPKGFVDFVYNVNKMNMVFALSSVALAIVTAWMIWADYDREWKGFQRENMRMDEYQTQVRLEQAQKAVDQDVLKGIEAEIERVNQSLESQASRHEAALDGLETLRGDFYRADQNLKFERASYDVFKYEFEEASHSGHVEEAAEKKEHLEEMNRQEQGPEGQPED